MQIVDDMERVMQLKQSWQKKKSEKTIRSRLSSVLYPNKTITRVPHLTRHYNTIEQNIFAVSSLNKTISHIYQSPNRVTTSVTIDKNATIDMDDTFYQFPSNQLTKQENIMAITSIQNQFSIFKTNSGKSKKFQPKSNSTKNPKYKIDQYKLNQSLDNPSNNNNFLINNKTVIQNGIKFPYKLLILNNSRHQVLANMLNYNETSIISNADDLESIKQKDSKIYQQEIKSSQNEKKRQELLSRGYMTNAFYSLMAMNKKQQSHVKAKYQTLLPKDSRFYEL